MTCFPRRISIGQTHRAIGKRKVPRIVTFDAYNTLYSTTIPVMEHYCLIGKKYGISANPQQLTQNFPKVFGDLRAQHPTYGKHTGLTPEEWWATLITNVFKPTDIPSEMIDEILTRFEGFDAYTVYPDLLDFLKKVKDMHSGIVLGVVSNTDPIMYKLLKNIQLTPFFHDHIYLSYDLGVSKPDSKFFDMVLQDIIKKHPGLLQNGTIEELKLNCWHIGDEKNNDLKGASNAGWNGVLIDRMNKYGYLCDGFEKLERDEEMLSTDKIENNSTESWQMSMKQNDIIQLSDREFVISNFHTLSDFLL